MVLATEKNHGEPQVSQCPAKYSELRTSNTRCAFYLSCKYRSLNARVAHSKNWPLGVNTTIDLKKITATSASDSMQRGMFQRTSAPLLPVVVVIFFSSIVVTPDGFFF